MRTVFARTGGALALFLAASAAWAADPQVKPAVADEGGVHRMVIYNGAVRTVHYLSDGLSPGDQAALHNLEQAENQVSLADQLLALRQQYVGDERVLETRRRHMQELLYGYNSESSVSDLLAAGYPYGYYGGPFGFSPYTAFPGYGGGLTAFAGASGSNSNTLAVGVGDEGAIKSNLAVTLAGQATPDFAAQASQHLALAMDQVGRSTALASALHMQHREPIATVGAERITAGRPVVVTRTLDGKTEKISGTVVRDDPNWLVLQTKEGRLTINKSHVQDILEKAPPSK
ncbi:MAG TPA: hypothetical protein VJ739_14335 [Gemmataceae bacterium]|nr:hypothetical protein [Gemmataceae bacterium]